MRSLVVLSVALCLMNCGGASAADPSRPNIVLIYADDLGYGDVGCYGATKIKTPHIDRLASEGLLFRDAHSTSATCTPSRYALLTGEYPWRRKGTGILPGNAKLIVEPGRSTLASMLKEADYQTAVVGKWHLGLGDGTLDWNGPILPGPLEIGFDYSFLIPATGDRVPCVYVENHHVVGLEKNDPIRVSYSEPIPGQPTGRQKPELLKVKPSHGHDQAIVNGISRIGHMSGGANARWIDEDMADVITAKAVDFVKQNQKRPFFLLFSTHDIHVPRAPHSRFAGVSGTGTRGDVICQLDWCVGELAATIERLGLDENTLIIVSSDNGPVLDDGYHDGAVEELNGHQPTGPWRGGKYSAFEAGTRVPFIVRWKSRVKPSVSDALLSQVDLLASLAALTGQEVAANEAVDSLNLLPALLGETATGREQLVEQAGVLSLRHGPWKLIEPGKGPKQNANTKTELGNDARPQLYHLGDDPGETTNLAARHPERVQQMQSELERIRRQGGSGEKESNSASSRPRVLLLGDSISIGYTPFVQQMLASEAEVVRPMRNERQAENCAGTKHGVESIGRWLETAGKNYDVIHFNFGLHDIKHVDATTGANSDRPTGVRQSEPEQYEKQLRQIVGELKKSGAQMIFATTTPVPTGRVRPHRDVADPQRYNKIARQIMEQEGVAINDLYAFALPQLETIQKPRDVHFKPEGSKRLAEQVTQHVRRALTEPRARKDNDR